MNQRESQEFVTCVQAAELLCVSVSTVKRLCDQQTLDCSRTSGGHRRISMQSISRLIVLQKSQEVEHRRPDQEYSVQDIDCTLDWLLSGSVNDLNGFLVYLQTQGWTIPRILDEVLLAALRSCQSLHYSEEIPPYGTNQCIAAVRDLIGYLRVRQGSPATGAPMAVGGCVGPARHDLNSSAIAVGLGAIGYRALSIGCRVHPNDIADVASLHRAKVVWMNCSHIVDADEIMQFTRQLSNEMIDSQLMLITGIGTSGPQRRHLPCDLASDSIMELTNFVVHRTARDASILGNWTDTRNVA